MALRISAGIDSSGGGFGMGESRAIVSCQPVWFADSRKPNVKRGEARQRTVGEAKWTVRRVTHPSDGVRDGVRILAIGTYL